MIERAIMPIPVAPADLVWQPMTPAWVILLLLGGGAALAAVAYGRAARQRRIPAIALLVMRLVSLAALGAILAGPSIIPPAPDATTRPDLYILIDNSASMRTHDVDGAARIDALLDRYLSPDAMDALSESFSLHIMSFDETAHALGRGRLADARDALANAPTSRYAQSLRDALIDLQPGSSDPDTPPAAMLVLGDGHDTADEPAAAAIRLATERNVAVHAIVAGSTASPPDLSVNAIAQPQTLFENESGRVTIHLRGVGPVGPTVTVRIDGPGIETPTHEVRLDERGEATLEAPFTADAEGPIEFDVAVDAAEGESVVANNRIVAFAQVAKRRARVLILEGQPHWDTRFIAQALRLDGRVLLTQITQVADDKREHLTSATADDPDSPDVAVPTTLDEFGAYDVVILGRSVERLLDAGSAAAMAQWVVQSGGRLVLARGRPYEPDTPAGQAVAEALALVEPVVWGDVILDDVPVAISPAGRGHPMLVTTARNEPIESLFASLPPLRQVRRAASIRPAAIVLAQAGQARGTADRAATDNDWPVLLDMGVGRGRVVAVSGQGLWRWRLLPEALDEATGVFDSIWTSAVRWLATGADFSPGSDISLDVARSSVRVGDELLVEAAARPAAAHRLNDAAIVITDPAGVEHRLALGADGTTPQQRQTRFRATEVGVHRVRLELIDAGDAATEPPPRRSFSVYDPSTERLDTAARPYYLRDIAERTGGLFITCGEPIDLPAAMQRRIDAATEPPRPAPAWDRGPLLAGLLAWLGIEWLARRRYGWA